MGKASGGLALSNLSVTTFAVSQTAIGLLDTAIASANVQRGKMGTAVNRLTSAVANLSDSIQAQSAAESQIRDLDVARETAEFTRLQIMQQAGTAVLAQANSSAEMVLLLFR